jgi:RNA polymerase sigma-B factor
VYYGTRDEESLLDRYQASRDLAARDELIRQYLPLVRRLAKRYAYTTEPLDDLVQVGSIALLKAVERYERGKGASFKAYAVPTIVGEMRRHFRDTGWALHVPRSLQERAREVGSAMNDLSGQLERSPTIAEIARWTKLSNEDVIEALEVRMSYDATSLESGVRNGDEDAWLQRLGSDDERYETVEYAAVIERTLKAMPARERVLIHLRFFEDLSQSEIAKRVGFSQMHVSRLLRRAMARLEAVAAADGPAPAAPVAAGSFGPPAAG